jgi:hypothetical protein
LSQVEKRVEGFETRRYSLTRKTDETKHILRAPNIENDGQSSTHSINFAISFLFLSSQNPEL